MICQIRYKKFFATVEQTAYYSIENNCILVHYFNVKKEKTELFYNLSDLTIKHTDRTKEILVDTKKGIQIEIPISNDTNSLDTMQKTDEEDHFFGFESSGYKAYSEEAFCVDKSSFTQNDAQKIFSE
ncbi:Hypothetical_protein [Hexamita inflata]|uniref:Hypothetical_protein n=1 Tax=Hexamita inflata TaxID=28002 RepID=A0AA86PGV2_9EUKA|nr:Hypothetical protein HINF_LOCUS26346 [Hexamita inflata]